MNKTQLTEAVAEITGTSASEAASYVDAVLKVMVHTVANAEPVTLAGLGTLQPYIRAPRRARNPQTGDVVDVDARMWARLRPARRLLDYANGAIPLPDSVRDVHLKAPRTASVPVDGHPGDVQ